MRAACASLAAAALFAPQAIAQDVAPGTKMAECRMALRDAMQTALKYPVNKREKDPDTGQVTAVLQSSGLTVIGQPALGLNVTRSVDPVSTGFVTKVALDYPQVRTALPKAYGKAKCSAEGTAITYCLMTLPDDLSMGARHRVTMSAEPAEGGGTMLTCLYEKLDG